MNVLTKNLMQIFFVQSINVGTQTLPEDRSKSCMPLCGVHVERVVGGILSVRPGRWLGNVGHLQTAHPPNHCSARHAADALMNGLATQAGPMTGLAGGTSQAGPMTGLAGGAAGQADPLTGLAGGASGPAEPSE